MDKAWIFLIVIPFITFGQTNTFPSSGNVGIGTLSPEAKLKVVRSSNIGGTWNPTSSIFTIAEAGNSLIMDPNEIFGSKTLYIGSKSGDIVHFRSVSETGAIDRMVINSNGDIGIGNTSPTERLHVSGNILANKLMLNDPITTTDWNTVWQSGFYEGYNVTNAPEPNQWFWSVIMNHSSDNPNYRYTGQIAIRNSYTQPRMYFRSTNVNGLGTWSRIVHSEGDQLINGRLGIGTNTPDSKLTVKGKIHAEEVMIDLSVPGADYVFKDGYDLRSMKEVRQYIKEHGHLPNVPSAKSMEENGVELGIMSMKLLEKVEELTLYTLDQETAIQDLQVLKKENKALQEKVGSLEKMILKLMETKN